jgi:hypothetical protein
LYVYEGNFNHFEHKLYQTKPIFRKKEMNLNNYMTSNYSNNSGLSTMQKQSQTNPKQSQNLLAIRSAKPNQSQTNPIYAGRLYLKPRLFLFDNIYALCRKHSVRIL